MATILLYICAVIGWLLTCIVAYALGWCEGRNQGKVDGYEEAVGECRRRCAK